MLMRNQHLYSHRNLWSLKITITLTERALLIFLQYRVEKLLGIELTTLDLNSLSGAYDHSATATPIKVALIML